MLPAVEKKGFVQLPCLGSVIPRRRRCSHFHVADSSLTSGDARARLRRARALPNRPFFDGLFSIGDPQPVRRDPSRESISDNQGAFVRTTIFVASQLAPDRSTSHVADVKKGKLFDFPQTTIARIRHSPVPISTVQNLNERREPVRGGVGQLKLWVFPAGRNWETGVPSILSTSWTNFKILAKHASSIMSSPGSVAGTRIPGTWWQSGMECPPVFASASKKCGRIPCDRVNSIVRSSQAVSRARRLVPVQCNQ